MKLEDYRGWRVHYRMSTNSWWAMFGKQEMVVQAKSEMKLMMGIDARIDHFECERGVVWKQWLNKRKLVNK